MSILKETRLARGVSQKALAKSAGVSQAAISYLEVLEAKGVSLNPGWFTASRIARRLRTPVGTIFPVPPVEEEG